ncbi:MAG: hypothetical protein UU09_C0011G0021 [Microgenomates group bacterium GW2011_GWA2_40_6]|nr:MAG: hypothetical protein UU09_C0011G0021 [Microgenomates group bacterium GW2011_GWA2_40_6]
MKKFLKYALYLSFALVLQQELFGNLLFGQNRLLIITKVGLILAFFEIFLKPIVKILLLPISILTLGLIRIVINTLGLYLASSLVSAFSVTSFAVYGWSLVGFWAYLGTSFFISVFLYIFKII